MAQLNADVAEKVEKAQDNFALLPPHIVVATLVEDVEIKEGQKAPYWVWKFKTDEDSPVGPNRTYRNRTSLSEAAFFKLKEVFTAFGVPATTDTAELVGKKVRLEIVCEVMQGGSRAGEYTNNIASVLPLNTEDGKVGFTGQTGEVPADALAKNDPSAPAPGGSSEAPLF